VEWGYKLTVTCEAGRLARYPINVSNYHTNAVATYLFGVHPAAWVHV